MRICITAEEFLPFPSGRLKRIYEIAKRLAKNNEVHIYCQRYGGALRDGIVDGIHVHGVVFQQLPLHFPQDFHIFFHYFCLS